MNKTLNDLKQKAIDDYELNLKRLQDEHKKNLNAIDRVFSLMGNENLAVAESAVNDTTQDKQVTQHKMATSDDVRTIIDDLRGKWTVRNIRDEAAKMDPPLEVSKNVIHNVIKKKRENSEIETIEKGVGRAPSIYRNVEYVEYREDVPIRTRRRRKKENDGYEINEGSGSLKHPESSI